MYGQDAPLREGQALREPRSVNVDGREIPMPLRMLRTFLGDVRVEELQERVAELRFAEDYSTEELVCIEEFFRLCSD